MGTDVVGAPHPSRRGETITPDTTLDACEVHVAKRVVDERWAQDTSVTEYLGDIRAAAGHADARLHVGEKPPPPGQERRYQRVAATLTLVSSNGLQLQKVQRKPGLTVFVSYDADRSCVITGYTEPDEVVHMLLKQWRNRRIIPKRSGGSAA